MRAPTLPCPALPDYLVWPPKTRQLTTLVPSSRALMHSSPPRSTHRRRSQSVLQQTHSSDCVRLTAQLLLLLLVVRSHTTWLVATLPCLATY